MLPWVAKNPALSGALLVCVLLGAALAMRTTQLTTARAERDAQTAIASSWKLAADVGTKSLAAQQEAGSITRGSLDRTLVELETCTAVRAGVEGAAAAALRRADGDLADAKAALAGMAGQMADALRDPACGICLNQPICPSLKGIRP